MCTQLIVEQWTQQEGRHSNVKDLISPLTRETSLGSKNIEKQGLGDELVDIGGRNLE